MLVQAVGPASVAHQNCWLSYSKGKSILTCSLAFPCETTDSSLLWQTSTPSALNVSRHKDDLFTRTVWIRSEQEDDDHSHDPTLSDKTISLWWMPTQVCWHPDSFLSSLFLASLSSFICIIPVTLRLITPVWFAYLCLKIEDRHSHSKYSPARNKLSNVVLVGWGISREKEECGIFLGSITHKQPHAHPHTDNAYRVLSKSPSSILFLSPWPQPNTEGLGKWRPYYSSCSWYKQKFKKIQRPKTDQGRAVVKPFLGQSRQIRC